MPFASSIPDTLNIFFHSGVGGGRENENVIASHSEPWGGGEGEDCKINKT